MTTNEARMICEAIEAVQRELYLIIKAVQIELYLIRKGIEKEKKNEREQEE